MPAIAQGGQAVDRGGVTGVVGDDCHRLTMLIDGFARAPVCEVYRCDADGVITVELRRPTASDARRSDIARG